MRLAETPTKAPAAYLHTGAAYRNNLVHALEITSGSKSLLHPAYRLVWESATSLLTRRVRMEMLRAQIQPLNQKRHGTLVFHPFLDLGPP